MKITTILTALCLAFSVSAAGASTINLFESATLTTAGSTTDLLTGEFPSLGSYTFHFNSAGSHFGGIYLDYELNEPENTFFNEYGAVAGTAPIGLSWEVGMPEINPDSMDIYDNFFANSLTNAIFNGLMTGPEDVAIAMLWNFTLGAGERADLTFTASTSAPEDRFYLAHYDGADGADALYFYADLKVEPTGPEPVPEPSTLLLLGAGLGAAVLSRKKQGAR